MGVLMNGARVGEPVIDVDADGQPVFWNALYNGVQVWPPAAETLVDVWLKPVDFQAQPLYADHPEIKVAAQKVFADGHIEDAALTLSTADSTVASINGGTVSFVSDASNFLIVQPDRPSTAPTVSLWCRTEKLHNGLKYYTGAVGDDANVMCFLLDRIREVWRREWDGWKLLTGKELENHAED